MLTPLILLLLLADDRPVPRSTSVVVALESSEDRDVRPFGTHPLELRLGESVGGFPSWSERVIHQWMNRARVDPQTELRECGSRCADAPCYAPVAPLAWSDGLNRAARFHADEMRLQGFFGHDSKCAIVSNIDALYPAGCSGSASCACLGGTVGCPLQATCTPWAARIGLFGANPSAEIIASTAKPLEAFYLWLWEPAASSSCGFSMSNGHRWAILATQGAVGVGVSGMSVGDFGSGPPLAKIPSGAHYPRQGASVEILRPVRSASVRKEAARIGIRRDRRRPAYSRRSPSRRASVM